MMAESTAASLAVNREETAALRDDNNEEETAVLKLKGSNNKVAAFVYGFFHLFDFRRKFSAHRVFGLTFLIQYCMVVYLYNFDYDRFLSSPLVVTLPLNALVQSFNAALTFTFLPKKEDPGFAAVSDNSVLSYFTIVENSFYSLQLLFAFVYLHEDHRVKIKKLLVVEPTFVFFVFYLRHLWPSSRITASLKNEKNKSDKNRLMLKVSAYAIKCFYLFAKHFIGAFPLYLVFLNRIDKQEQRVLYGVQVLSAYASTISIFIHTLKFKNYIGPTTAMVAYDIIIPGFAYLYYHLAFLFLKNQYVAMLCGVAMVLNLAPKVLGFIRPWFVWQMVVCYLCYTNNEDIMQHVDLRLYFFTLFALAVHWFRPG